VKTSETCISLVLCLLLAASCSSSRIDRPCSFDYIDRSFRDTLLYSDAILLVQQLCPNYQQVPSIGIALGPIEKYSFDCNGDSCYIVLFFDPPLTKARIQSTHQPRLTKYEMLCRRYRPGGNNLLIATWSRDSSAKK